MGSYLFVSVYTLAMLAIIGHHKLNGKGSSQSLKECHCVAGEPLLRRRRTLSVANLLVTRRKAFGCQTVNSRALIIKNLPRVVTS